MGEYGNFGETFSKIFTSFSGNKNQTNPIFIFEFIQSSIVIHRIGQVKTDLHITKRSLYFDKNQHHTITI